MAKGLLYVLTNEAMPELVKIGFTNGSDIEERMKQLYASTAVPLPFECYFAAEVEKPEEKEKLLHQLFDDKRVNKKREFFKVEPERVVTAIRLCEYKEKTPSINGLEEEDKAAIEKEKIRRSKINLEKIGINVGSTLIFSRDNSIVALVKENNKIEINGELKSLSQAALDELHKLGSKTTSVSGSDFWMYEGELLDERRKRIEEEE